MKNIFDVVVFKRAKNKWEVVNALLKKIEQLDSALIQPSLYYETLYKATGSQTAADIKTMLDEIRKKYTDILDKVLESKE